MTVRRASEEMDVPYMDVVNVAWAEGLTLVGITDPVEMLSPYIRQGKGMAEILELSGMAREVVLETCKAAKWAVPE